MILTPNIGFKIFTRLIKYTKLLMKKLITISAIVLLAACQTDDKQEKEIALSLDACEEISEEHLGLVMNAEVETIETWPGNTINIVLDDFSALDEHFNVNHEQLLLDIFADFEQQTGINIEVFEEENAPDNYVFYQHAFWDGGFIGFKTGKNYASTGTFTIKNNPETILHFLSHIAGSQTGNIEEVKELY